MKNFVPFALLFFFFISCKKENNNLLVSSASESKNLTAAKADTVAIPLTELGMGTYYGYVGGLYPNGANQPSGVYGRNLYKAAAQVTPLDAAGNKSSTGVIGFISIGSSLGSKMFLTLESIATANDSVNKNIVFANCTGGSKYVELVNDTTSDYWPIIHDKLKNNRITEAQVQILYMETEDSISTAQFPDRALHLENQFIKALQVFKVKFPNLKIVYLGGRTTTFLNDYNKVQNKEPAPYYNGWACKWLIEDQINNNPALAYKGRNAVAPMVTWGWYKWSIGNVTRSDGFYWTDADTEDGMHPTDDGAYILAYNFHEFFLHDTIAKRWYAAPNLQ